MKCCDYSPCFAISDIKQWTNCRVGMLGWALLVIVFCVAGIEKNGFTLGPVVNATLINIYLVRPFYIQV
jgi:7-dehydrocholesterol reductase